MKIGEWVDTMKDEEKFWRGWFETISKGPPIKRAFQWEHTAMLILEEIGKRGIVLSPQTRALEIGGGAVGRIRWFPSGKLFTVDPLEDLFSEYRPRLGPAWEKLRQDVTSIGKKAETLPMDLEKFDIILAINMIDHCENPEKVLANIAGLLRGLFFEATTIWEPPGPAAYGEHPHLYFPDEFFGLMDGLGFIQMPFMAEDFIERWTRHWGKGAWPCYPRLWHIVGVGNGQVA